MRTITIGVDLAKQVFAVCSVDAAGRVEDRRDLRRDAFKQWLPNVPAGTIVAMEACSGAHHWGRRCQDYGLEPRLMAAQFVAPFRKSRTAKNDRHDAEAMPPPPVRATCACCRSSLWTSRFDCRGSACARVTTPRPWPPSTGCVACWRSSAS